MKFFEHIDKSHRIDFFNIVISVLINNTGSMSLIH